MAPPLSAHVQTPLKWLVALERVDAACRGGDGVEGEGGMCAGAYRVDGVAAQMVMPTSPKGPHVEGTVRCGKGSCKSLCRDVVMWDGGEGLCKLRKGKAAL